MAVGIAIAPTSASAQCSQITRGDIDATNASVQTLVDCGDPSGAFLVFPSSDGPITMEVPPAGESSILSITYVPGHSGISQVSVTQFSEGEVGFTVENKGQVTIGGDSRGRDRAEERETARLGSSTPSAAPFHGSGGGAGSTLALSTNLAMVTKCTSAAYGTLGWWQVSQYAYNINTSGMPTGGSAAIQAAANTVSDAIDGCGLAGTTGIPDQYSGTTTASSNVQAGGVGCNSQDLISVQKFGVISNPSIGAVTCTGTNGFGWVTHTDNVYNNALSWYTGTSTSGCTGSKLDLQAVATHEIGHSFGLDDVADTTQVMGTGAYCQTSKRLLGSGDHAGLMAIY